MLDETNYYSLSAYEENRLLQVMRLPIFGTDA